ncbi:hypothetical protein JQ557_06570 [Bradyrhizobium sp. U87765 SZCCT0131]|uniref:hypothetical protein n=1 Tax=unclassified Bradyrhizobium TaxID=2631580 RepID=UPI001BA8AAD1|nr:MULTISPECIES: hypothetical protein [unclassified Bradyrhizobium]MBR1217644.1 hypothetical protein [Bradyrhizobium sp. U87765 SZCCT0131]MBR1261410.1 hypothetical protein [Bradyrhizobium sp. U87765 SZCCT0134]MBR1303142.1 hypothetical protein [Bradyrhizobium sp. U87765 SZCCT0110]MBR1318748.1 hypothetical protein [Bradyrhizobium sp. U87765 SZCCT0109]MBR1347073.1 hypothetical protein [Bradyrhizobium sp. U87765 SZCCT0048]
MVVSSAPVAKGYFDDSQTNGEVWAIGGYVGSFYQWKAFQQLWPEVLAKHGVPYFHMREMQKPNGVYAKWYPEKEHRQEVASFMGDLAEAIKESNLAGFGCLVRLKDLERFNVEKSLKLEPYALAAYGCMVLVGKDYCGHTTELIFDHVEKVQKKLDTAQKYAESDSFNGAQGIFDQLAANGLPEQLTFKDVPALQAADFWVWELRKNHLRMNEWWSLEDRPQEWGDEQWKHMERWVADKYGSFEAATRKSAQALLSHPNFTCMIWHYQELCDAHQSRGGVWP